MKVSREARGALTHVRTPRLDDGDIAVNECVHVCVFACIYGCSSPAAVLFVCSPRATAAF